MSTLRQQSGQRAHSGAGNSNQMNVHQRPGNPEKQSDLEAGVDSITGAPIMKGT
jgi:hypothetical protein